jgi:hypothetical protein
MFDYWTWIGTLFLIFLTYKDITNKMRIDDRHNFFMMGLTFSLFSHIPRPLWYMGLLILLTVVLAVFMTHFKVLGGADVSTISWLFYGYGIISAYTLLWFCIYFIVIMAVYALIKIGFFKYVMKTDHKQKTPFYPVLLCSYVFTNLVNGFY